MIQTERLTLRGLKLEDADDLLEYQSHPDVVRYTPWPVRERADVIGSLQKILALHSKELATDGDSLFLGWQLRDKNQVVGQSNMTLLSSSDRIADIGWATHHDFQRMGFAFEATSALLTFAFKQYSLESVIARIDVRNIESIRLAQKLGMTLAAEEPELQLLKDEWCHINTYEISRPQAYTQIGGGNYVEYD